MIMNFSNITTNVRCSLRMLSDTYIAISFIEMIVLDHVLLSKKLGLYEFLYGRTLY